MPSFKFVVNDIFFKIKIYLMNQSNEFGYKYYLTDEVYFIMLAYTCFSALILHCIQLFLIKET